MVTRGNVKAGGAKEPLSLIHVLNRFNPTADTLQSESQTPGQSSSLGLSLFHSSPLDRTELRQANALRMSQLSNVNHGEVVYSGKWCSTRDVMDLTQS